MLQSYRELRWRMVKMVRNADGMAISEKNRRFSVVISGKKHEKVLEMGRPKSK